MNRGLQLDLSIGREQYDSLEATYRNEGLSVGADHMRLFGEEVRLDVQYTDLIMGDRIGQGACSSVNLARHRVTNEIYAVKMFNIYDHAQASQLYNEILLLTSFQCDALISLKGAFHDQGCIGVILEYMDRGSLEFLMDPDIRLSEDVMAAIAFQIIWGLGYLHYERQIHRDIKPGNILMNSRGEVKLSDFGISKELDHTTAMSASAVGSYRYMSPERIDGDKYDASADVWSVGVSLVQLWNKEYPFHNCAETPIHLSGELQHFTLEKILPRGAGVSNQMREFLRSMFAINPNERASCMELTQSPWFEACGITTLPEAHHMVAKWLRDVDKFRKWKKASPTSKQLGSSYRSSHRLPNKNAAAIVRDVCEMSISLDASNSKWDLNELSLSRSQNPFTSSGNFSGNSMTQERGFGMNVSHNNNKGLMGPPVGLPSHYGSMHGGSGGHHNMNTSLSFNSQQQFNAIRRPLQAHPVKKVPTQDEYEEDFEQVDPYDQEQEELKSESRHSSHRGSGYEHSDRRYQEEKRSSSSSFLSRNRK